VSSYSLLPRRARDRSRRRDASSDCWAAGTGCNRHAQARGETLTTAAQKLHTGAVMHVGLNDWYMGANGSTTAIIKVRDGTVQEIGTATKLVTQDRKAQRTFLTSFS
jgi:hypothetical protein